MVDEEAVIGLAEAESLTGARKRFESLMGNFGFAAFSYVDIRKVPMVDDPIPFFQSTVRSDFLDSYQRERFDSHDPVIRRAAASNGTFNWYDCPEYARAAKYRRGYKNKARQILELALDHQFQNGVIVPAHSFNPDGTRNAALISLYWDDQERENWRGRALPYAAQMASFVLHQRVCELRDLGNDGGDMALLTDRERECLSWAAKGKTTGETADILCLSQSGVVFHLKSAMRKLGVYNKCHAVAVAIKTGLINI